VRIREPSGTGLGPISAIHRQSKGENGTGSDASSEGGSD